MQDACLHRMLQGLIIYSFLLKRVEKEFPGSIIPSEATFYCKVLMGEIQKKVGMISSPLFFLFYIM